MARIAGVFIPDNKKVTIALTYIHGVGRTTSGRILLAAKVDPDKRTSDLSAQEMARIRDIIEKSYKVEGDLRREVMMNVKRLKDISAYRGIRHMRSLPVNGQRTKSNSRTRRGNVRRTMASGRRTVEKK